VDFLLSWPKGLIYLANFCDFAGFPSASNILLDGVGLGKLEIFLSGRFVEVAGSFFIFPGFPSSFLLCWAPAMNLAFDKNEFRNLDSLLFPSVSY